MIVCCSLFLYGHMIIMNNHDTSKVHVTHAFNITTVCLLHYVHNVCQLGDFHHGQYTCTLVYTVVKTQTFRPI